MKHFLRPLMVVAVAAIIALPAYALNQARVVNPNGEKLYTIDGNTVFTLEELEEQNIQNAESQIIGGQAGNIVDVVGSRIGTTTTAVNFATNVASTTYPILIGREYDSVDFNIFVKEASTTPNMFFSVLASNDFDCNTSTTTTSMANTVVKGDINWFDIGSHILNLAGSKTLNSGTSTISWIPLSAGTGTILSLTDLNVNCLALEVNASGTSAWIQAQKKNLVH